MMDVIIGEKVINKSKQIGTIVSFDGNRIGVDFNTKIVSFLSDAFEKGFLKYEKNDLQADVDKTKLENEERMKELNAAKEKAILDRAEIQAQTSKKQFLVSIISASIRLSPAPLTLKSIRKKDVDLIQRIFAECDKDIKELYSTIEPEMKYLKKKSYAKSRYSVGFISKYLNTYVFRVFSRSDTYSKDSTKTVMVHSSDTTEVMRVLCVNGKVYYFSKNLSSAKGSLVNSTSHNNWHISNFDSSLLLNGVIKKCDCEYLNDYIAETNVNCLQYAKLLFAALYNNKAEIVFKNKLFAPTYYINDIIAYLDAFTPKQIDFASKNDLINALPIIKSYGNLELNIFKHIETIMRIRKYNTSVYGVLESHLKRLGFDCSDLVQKLINFLRKIDYFNASLYCDYINLLIYQPNITIQDFFDKHYIQRHHIMLEQKTTKYTPEEHRAYSQIAQELSWIDREENGYFIIVPKNISDFKYEGDMQHNCVYTNRYCKYVINRQSIIVFLRKEAHIPYVTIEYDYETFEVLQAYGKFNREIDKKLYQYIVDLGKRLNCEMLSQQ